MNNFAKFDSFCKVTKINQELGSLQNEISIIPKKVPLDIENINGFMMDNSNYLQPSNIQVRYKN